jgi:FKBP-type peptidyl-prolyl cis-trans isomerase
VLIVGLGSVHPGPTSTVTVNFWGWTTDGQLFDSSAREGGPQTFPLNQVIPGWTEGLQLMVKGEKRRFWIPSKLAYGDNPGSGNPAGMLVFDIELLEVR